ncbi:Uncharacterised protein [Vibrio cholerae]|nr:Uncharacterised protein [Vibrio cholerae]CSC40691.1 Uncharacterised protein [Vibrio cholerae]CSC71416.1 Uncharacterised protein [Vibrio cholerae]
MVSISVPPRASLLLELELLEEPSEELLLLMLDEELLLEFELLVSVLVMVPVVIDVNERPVRLNCR